MTEQPGAGEKSFRLEEATIEELHAAIRAGETTCVAVVKHYIERARAYNGVASLLVTEDGAAIPEAAGTERGGAPLAFPTTTVKAEALFPDLDSSFQGMNAWHSFQYLGLCWLMNKNSLARGEIDNRFFAGLMAPGRGTRFYAAGLGATLLLLAGVLGVALLIERWSGGEFLMFGHSAPVLDPATGRELYRPGAVLLAYYMTAFGLLLTHYLHDGVFFCRRRYLVGRRA